MGRCRDIVLAGGSYGGFIALDYAILHGDRLRGLILRDTWTHGLSGMMTSLAAVLTSDRIKVDVARQVRVWSGALHDDKDFEEAVQEIIPIYAPPENASSTVSAKDKAAPKAFEGTDPKGHWSGYHSATQNAAFSVNMPRWDVRHQLKEIQVNKRSPQPHSLTVCI